jgi:uncharacterized protein with von Willebrand factor type A (vWA) domain
MKETPCSLGCGEVVRVFDMRFHLKFECASRVVTCPIPYCQESFRAWEQQIHDEKECAAVKVRHRLVEQGIHMNELSLCTLCSEGVRLRDLEKHNLDECEQRVVKCLYEDCDSAFAAHKLQTHLQFECQSRHVLQRMLLVKRARERVDYARPWGFIIAANDANVVLDSAKPPGIS